MDNNSLKKKTVSGMLWKFAENGLNHMIHFVVSIVLARMLVPDDYGIIALVSVFITLCDKLVVSGFATSLIQKKDADNTDFSTVFWFSFCVALVLYAVLYASAPWIADFYDSYDRSMLIPVIRVMGLQVIMVSVNSVQNAYVSKTMQFKRFFWSTLGGNLLSAAVGITMAWKGFGVWALVAQYLLKMFGGMSVIWFTVKWRPILTFSRERFRALYNFGWKIFTASIIKVIYNDLRSLVIGKFYSSADLAFYNRGQSFPQLIESNITGTIDSVFFPAMSHAQSSKEAMRSMLRRTIQISTFILTPLLVGMAAVAEPLVIVLLTEKWLPCVFYLQILSLSFVTAPVEIENLQAIKALGRSDIVLKLEIIKRSVGIVLLIASVPFGVEAIAISLLISNLISAVLNAYPNRKLLGYGYRQQLMDVLPSFMMSAVMYGAVWAVSRLMLLPMVMLFVQIVAGAVVYVLLSVTMKNKSFQYLWSLVRRMLPMRR